MRTIYWKGDHVVLIDQTKLPAELVAVEVRSVDALIDAIVRLAVRGAPALGTAGAFGVAIASLTADREGRSRQWVHAEATRVAEARPTAVNLSWGVRRVAPLIDAGSEAVIAEALAIAEEDVVANTALGERGADLLTELCGTPMSLQTHCNTGALACVDWGTALGIVRSLHRRGHIDHVYADETRPLLQGARLTAWELVQMGVNHSVVVDGAGPTVIASGRVQAVVVGADRIAFNGDTANKIGTYPLALAAQRAGIPFIVAAPESTLDVSTKSGADIHIEMRDPDEVLMWAGVRTAPIQSSALNFAFDVTPGDLVTAIVTERRVIRPARGEHL
ncbi:MAG: S-methyl-5-thioribose-1-phosphate isomerase [Acidimicrobiia bacterium]